MAQVGEKTIHDMTNSSAIVKHLFIAELRRLDNELLNIIKQNEECCRQTQTAGFMYQGEFYLSKNATCAPIHGERLELDSSLYPMMMRYNEASARLLRECNMVNQMVFRLVQGCTSRQDIRDALPECLVAQDKEMGLLELPRTRPAAYTIAGDERATRQYNKVLPLFEYYAGSKLLF